MNPFDELSTALDAGSWEWLSENEPDVARGVEAAVQRKQKPNEIRKFVMIHCGRAELARRCEQAARYLMVRAKA